MSSSSFQKTILAIKKGVSVPLAAPTMDIVPYVGTCTIDSQNGKFVSSYDVYCDGAFLANISAATGPRQIFELRDYILVDGVYSITAIAKGGADFQNSPLSSAYEFNMLSIVLGVSGEAAANSNLTRTDSAVSLDFSINSSTGQISSDFDDVWPYSDITEVTDSVGNVFVRIPKFYIKRTYDSTTQKFATQISNVQGEGYLLSPAFVDLNGDEKDYCYIGKYDASGSSSNAYSKSGQSCLVNITHPAMRTACAANGTGYGMLDYWHWEIIQVLFMIEFATTDSQSIMRGRVDHSSAASTGSCDSLGTNKSGWNVNTMSMCYRGIENIWGNIWQWLDGCTDGGANAKPYVCINPNAYESGKTTAPYVQLNYNTTASGTVTKRLGYDSSYPLASFPTESNGTDAEAGGYYKDYRWAYGSCFLVGAGWVDGSNAGLWALYSISTSDANAIIGGRLVFFNNAF